VVCKKEENRRQRGRDCAETVVGEEEKLRPQGVQQRGRCRRLLPPASPEEARVATTAVGWVRTIRQRARAMALSP